MPALKTCAGPRTSQGTKRLSRDRKISKLWFFATRRTREVIWGLKRCFHSKFIFPLNPFGAWTNLANHAVFHLVWRFPSVLGTTPRRFNRSTWDFHHICTRLHSPIWCQAKYSWDLRSRSDVLWTCQIGHCLGVNLEESVTNEASGDFHQHDWGDLRHCDDRVSKCLPNHVGPVYLATLSANWSPNEKKSR